MTSTPPEWPLLNQMVDVSPLPPVSWLPQTIGWQLLAGVILLMCSVILLQLIRRYRFYRYRREALARLAQIATHSHEHTSLLFLLLKQTAVRADPMLASRFDTDLLEKLDQMAAMGPTFSTHIGERWLQALVNPSIVLMPDEYRELHDLTTRWLKRHRHPDAPRLWPGGRCK